MRVSWACVVLLVEFFAEAVVHNAYRLECPGINLKNGKFRRRQRGRFVKFSCNPGYLLAGEKHSTCVRGEWDPLPPKCVRPTCMNKVQAPTNGLIYPSHNGAALHFFCRAGYVLRGPSDVYCDGKQWDNNAPICTEMNGKPPLSCDFEDAEICGWTPDLNHDFDWRRENYNTPSGSIGTGPSFDHTKGIGKDGYYMYIESSSRNENDTARLISPVFDPMDSEVCFEFFYHMFGSTIGTLRVYLKRNSDSWNLVPRRSIFSKSGNQGDKWYRSLSALGYIEEEFQIVIEGVRGSKYVSDIAIDDVKVIPNCTGEAISSTTTSESPDTEIYPIVDTCENRCGEKEATTNETEHLTCDCDDDCFDNNRCCPDFFEYCVIASTILEETSTTDTSNDIDFHQKVTTARDSPTAKPVSSTELSNNMPKTFLTSTPVPVLKTSIHISTTATSKKPEILSSTISTPTTKTPPITTTKLPKTSPTTKLTSPKPKIVPKLTTARVIYIQPPPSTPEIFRKTIPPTSAPPKTSTYRYLKPTVSLRPILPKFRPIENKEVDDRDFDEVSVPKNNDELLLVTPPGPANKERSDEFESVLTRNFSETDKMFSQKVEENRSYDVVLIVMSVVGVAVVVVALGVVMMVRRYRNPASRIKFSSSGNSQSDVRFFPSDETLDFTPDEREGF